ncbi:MAG: mechanosensitive ion channel family protein [Gammaproteobacteria bacterium]
MPLQKALTDLLGKLENWGHGLLLLLPNIVIALLVVLLFWLLAKLLDRVLRKVLRRFSVGHEVIDLTAIAVFIFTTIAGLFVALDVLGLDKTVTSLLAGVGILGLVLGLAFQSTGENYVAGIYLSIQRPFRVGQIIGSGDYFGVVERIALRSTWLRVPEGQLVYLPNKKIFDNEIINYSESGKRRIDLQIGISYGENLEKVKRVATEAVAAIENRDQNRQVEFFYDGFGDSSIDFEIRFWIDFYRQPDYLAARSEAVMRIKRAFDENGITIPFPIRTLDFTRGIGGETLATQLRGLNLAGESPPADKNDAG